MKNCRAVRIKTATILHSPFLQILFGNHSSSLFDSFSHVIINNTGSQYIQYILLVVQLQRFDEATFKVLHFIQGNIGLY